MPSRRSASTCSAATMAATRFRVSGLLIEAGETAGEVGRDMGAALCREFANAGEVGDRQDAGHKVNIYAAGLDAVAQAQEEGIVKEELRDGAGRPVLGLVGHEGQVFLD